MNYPQQFDFIFKSPTINSQAYLQFAQSDTQPKIAKELVCLPTLFCRPEKQNQVSAKIESKVVL